MSIKTVMLNNLSIGPGHPIQLIGEIGQNHNGRVETAKRMIDMCKKSGIQLVKFQKRDIDNEFTKEAYNKPYTNVNSFGKIYGEHRKFLELSKEEHLELKNYATNKGMIYFCTPCDIPSLKIMEERLGERNNAQIKKNDTKRKLNWNTNYNIRDYVKSVTIINNIF